MAVLEGIARRVVLTGSESTGKTTLAAELARHFGAPWIPEYVRGYMNRKGAPLDAGDVEPIARGQIAVLDAELARAGHLIILDTDLLSTVLYAEHYYGSCPEWIRQEAHARRGDLYLLAGIDVPWTPDPQRDRAHNREEMAELFRHALDSRRLPFVSLRGGRRERFEAAVGAIERSIRDLRHSGT
ncbi:MAG TPA: ATP-binding protein [Gemmatimonadales bacterium]